MLFKTGKRHILLSALAIITVVVTLGLAGCVTVTPTVTPDNNGGTGNTPAPSQGAKVASLSGIKTGGDTGIFSKVAVNTTLDNDSSLVSFFSRGNGIKGMSDTWNGVLGVASTTGTGVAGGSDSGMGMYGTSKSGTGVKGESNSGTGVMGESNSGAGVVGKSATMGYGVFGTSKNSKGVYGESTTNAAIEGRNTGTGNFGDLGDSLAGVYANGNDKNPGVFAHSSKGYGVHGESYDSYGVYAYGDHYGVLGHGDTLAGLFEGNVKITGTLTKGSGTFKIDNPQDPENKYLSHSFVESPDMKNVYDGTILLNASGEATVNLPSYFEALNRDFRYQLTCIGGYAPVYVASEIKDNQFKISGGTTGLKVSWMVTGIRQDPFAKAHPVVVEEEKPATEKGLYLHPVEYGQPKEKGIDQLAKP